MCTIATASVAQVDLDVEDFASEDEEDIAEICPDVLQEVTRSEEQVVDMLGGYCVTRLGKQGKLQCQECRQQLLKTQRGILLHERQYKECTKQALFSSSPSLYQFLLHTERKCREWLQTALHSDGIGALIRKSVWAGVPRLQCCHPAAAGEAILTLYLRVRLHHQS